MGKSEWSGKKNYQLKSREEWKISIQKSGKIK